MVILIYLLLVDAYTSFYLILLMCFYQNICHKIFTLLPGHLNESRALWLILR